MQQTFKLCIAGVGLLLVASLSAADPPASRVVAHRGLLLHAPENTLANFRACLALRLGFEFDVQRSKDGHLVCIHDATVDRTTNDQGRVANLTLAQIKQLDAGRWFDRKFAGETVPSVEEVLKLLVDQRQSDVLIAVDLKAEGVEHDVVRLAEGLGVLNRLVFIGNTIASPEVREKIKRASASAQVASLAADDKEFERLKADAHIDWIYVRFLPSKEQVTAAHRAGKRVFIAGPLVSGNTPDAWRQAVEVALDGILTDYATELAEVIRSAARP